MQKASLLNDSVSNRYLKADSSDEQFKLEFRGRLTNSRRDGSNPKELSDDWKGSGQLAWT